MSLTFGSLFSGIGGLDLGFEWAGMSCKWQVEIVPFRQKILEKNFPGISRHTDVREVGKHNLEPVDVICGGFPCQPHSLAGKRKGKADDRNLWPEYRRIVAELNPAWVVGENVPGIVTTILDQVLSDLEGLSYAVAPLIIPACAFNAPHRRDRVFIVAHANRQQANEQCGRQIEFGGQQGQSLETWEEAFRQTQNETGHDNPSRFYQVLSHPNGQRCSRPTTQPQQARRQRLEGRNWWKTEPGVGRVVDGLPNRMDRLAALGDAVTPQQGHFIANLILRLSNNSL